MRLNRLAVFGFVVGAGTVAGAIAASVITVAVGAVFSRSLVPMAALIVGARVGAVFGGIIGPLTAFTFLRRVPSGFGLMICSVGAAVGGSVGLYFGLDSLNPYVSFAIYHSPKLSKELLNCLLLRSKLLFDFFH